MPKLQTSSETLPDVQAEQDLRGRAIQKVGVSKVRIPFRFDSANTCQSTIGVWDLFVSLPAEKRGTHMSRLMEIMSSLGETLSLPSLVDLCDRIRDRLEASDAYLTVAFPWFIDKKAPITGMTGKLDFEVQIEICRGTHTSCEVTLSVPATSLCPCSKQISDYGAHNQRCDLVASVRFSPGASISLEELFEILENAASAPLFSVLKRDDEKEVTEKAYENPKFVEDTVRDLADALDRDSRIQWYRCSCENFESIHNHNAFAQIESE